MVIALVVSGAYHVDNGFDVARRHLHQDSHTHLTANEFQLVQYGALCQILHVDIDSSYDVRTVNRQRDGDVHVFVQHLAATSDTRCATQYRVVA